MVIFVITAESHPPLASSMFPNWQYLCTFTSNTCLSVCLLSVCLSVVCLSLHFNGHFPGEPGLAGVYRTKGWWRWWWQLDYWSYKLCNAPVESSPPTNQHPVFYTPDALPVAQPTVSKHWSEKITFHGLAYLRLTWRSSNFDSDH